MDYSAPCTFNAMSKGERLTHLPSQALFICLQQLVMSLQEEHEETQAQPLAESPPVSTELWRKEDVDAFVEALHSIRAKAPNGGFKPAHFREVAQILKGKVPDGMAKTPDQLSSKYQDVSFFFMTRTDQDRLMELKHCS
jgi:hypothetical protein